MQKSKLSKNIASNRHRAVCQDDTFKGPWRVNIDDAYQDARVHRQKKGNELHILRIFTEQTTSKRYE